MTDSQALQRTRKILQTLQNFSFNNLAALSLAELPMEMFKVTALENNLGWKRPLEAAWQT